MLVRNYNSIDIKNYESKNNINILSFFNNPTINNILEMIKLGNGNCDDEIAANILDTYLEEHTFIDAVIEIKENLLGKGENNEQDSYDNNLINITQYSSLTDLYIRYSMELMSVGLSYSEFWSMNTKEMFKVFNSIIIKIQNETNRELSNYHTLAHMVGSAVWGKLQKKPPQVEIKQENNEMIDGLDSEDLANIAKIKAIAKKFNNKGG